MAKKNTAAVSTMKPSGKIETSKKGIKSFHMDLSEFNRVEAVESYLGLNVLTLEINEAAGPLVITAIAKNFKPKSAKAKKMKNNRPLVKYSATDADGNAVELPFSASFQEKAEKAKLSVGDVIAIARGEDYEANGRDDCNSFQLKVLSRK